MHASAVAGRLEEGGKEAHGFLKYPALDPLSLPLHLQEAGPPQLLDVVGDGRFREAEPLPQVPDALADPLGGRIAAVPGRAARRQPQEDPQPLRIGQGVQHHGKVVYFDRSEVRHISNYRRKGPWSQPLFRIIPGSLPPSGSLSTPSP